MALENGERAGEKRESQPGTPSLSHPSQPESRSVAAGLSSFLEVTHVRHQFSCYFFNRHRNDWAEKDRQHTALVDAIRPPTRRRCSRRSRAPASPRSSSSSTATATAARSKVSRPGSATSRSTCPTRRSRLAQARWGNPGIERSMLPIGEAIEQLAYDFLEETHARLGESIDGAYGEFTFDVAARTITLDYNGRDYRHRLFPACVLREAAMGHCYHHALSSAKKWGGTAEEFLPLHQWFDEPSKSDHGRFSPPRASPSRRRHIHACYLDRQGLPLISTSRRRGQPIVNRLARLTLRIGSACNSAHLGRPQFAGLKNGSGREEQAASERAIHSAVASERLAQIRHRAGVSH